MRMFCQINRLTPTGAIVFGTVFGFENACNLCFLFLFEKFLVIYSIVNSLYIHNGNLEFLG